MQRRGWLAATGSSLALTLPCSGSFAASLKVLRAAFPSAEVGFDPIQIADESSLTVVDLIFEAPLSYIELASPAVLKPLTGWQAADVGLHVGRRARGGISPTSTRAELGQRNNAPHPSVSIT